MIRITLKNGSVIDWRGCLDEPAAISNIQDAMAATPNGVLAIRDDQGQPHGCIRITEVASAIIQ